MSCNCKKRRNDVILIAIIIVVALLLGLYLQLFKPAGDTVEVTVDGKLYGRYSLSEELTEDIHTNFDGQQLNRLIIKDGKAYIGEASCPDGICAAHRPIYRDGESIICLPNRVVVTVVAADSGDAPDIVT